MKIILDTNILRQDFFLKSRKFEMLLDFTSKTNYEIVFPDIIFKEIIALYKRTLLEKQNTFLKNYTVLQKTTIIPINYDLPDLNINKQVEEFTKNLKKKLKIDTTIPTNNNHLPDLIERAINRIHPFTEHRAEFRDALIWLCLLELAQSQDGKTIIFISANTKDFAGKDFELNEDLMKETKLKGIFVQYFSSIDSFLKTKAAKIDFITNTWIEENIDFDQFEEEIVSKIGIYSIDKLGELAEKENKYFEEVLSVIQCVNTWLNDFYIYEMSDGSIRVEAIFESELEVEYATREIIKNKWDHEYIYNRRQEEYECEPVYKEKVVKEAGYECFYPITEIEVHLIVRDNKIISTELVNYYI